MTNIQDDQLNQNNTNIGDDINAYQPPSTSDAQSQSTSDDQAQATGDSQPQAVASEDQTAKPKPSKADVDELLKQLEALNQEIAAKTVVDQPQLEEKKDQAEKLEAPPTPPAIESSDEIQLPASSQTSDLTQTSDDQQTTQSSDSDLDKFINDLEAKIADKNESEKKTEKPEEVPQEHSASIKEEQSASVDENFSQKRPSLDLSAVDEQEPPALTLNNGQLQEKQDPDQADLNSTVTPSVTAAISSATPSSTSPTIPNVVPTPVTKSKFSLDTDTLEATDAEQPFNEEDLESQNIFTMLSLEHLEDTEKEAFLSDLEKLIWDNFIEVELPLLLNSEEKAQADQILADSVKAENERKEALLVYLEEIVPNLEEMMYKKALSLKKEMFEERINKMREQAAEENNLSLIADLDQIQDLAQAGRYKTAVELLNKT